MGFTPYTEEQLRRMREAAEKKQVDVNVSVKIDAPEGVKVHVKPEVGKSGA